MFNEKHQYRLNSFEDNINSFVHPFLVKEMIKWFFVLKYVEESLSNYGMSVIYIYCMLIIVE